MDKSVPKRKYYPALDGLRGIAILLVLLQHNFEFLNVNFYGWTGVDLFFVLSGFLITEILLCTLENQNFFRNFYLRRILRIFPIYYFLLFLSFFILPNINQFPAALDYYSGNQIWHWLYLQNWLYIFNDPFGTKILLHTWSLAVQEQFYLIWPLLVMLIKKPKRLLITVLTLLISIAIIRTALWKLELTEFAYSTFYTFTRIDGLCIGSMIALLIKVKPGYIKRHFLKIIFLIAVLNIGFYFLKKSINYSLPYFAIVGYTTLAIIFGLIVHEVVAEKSKIISFLLDRKILKFFGRISYGLYVYHWPVYLLLYPELQKMFETKFEITKFQADLTSAIITTLIASIISFLSYEFFEKHFLKLKTKFI